MRIGEQLGGVVIHCVKRPGAKALLREAGSSQTQDCGVKKKEPQADLWCQRGEHYAYSTTVYIF